MTGQRGAIGVKPLVNASQINTPVHGCRFDPRSGLHHNIREVRDLTRPSSPPEEGDGVLPVGVR